MMKKIFSAVIALALVLSLGAVVASAEVYAGKNETIPEQFSIPQANGTPAIDGVRDVDFYGEPLLIAVGADRYEDVMYINPRGDYTDEQYEMASAIVAKYYFRWDKDYLYILVEDTKQFSSDAQGKDATWNNVDSLQIALVPFFPDETSHIGFSIVAPMDLSEAWPWVFEPRTGTDGPTAEEGIKAKVGATLGLTTWELAVPWGDALAMDAKVGDTISMSLAFFFNSETSGLAWQVGRGVFGADKDYAFNPVGVLAEALSVETTEPETTEPEETEPETTEPEEAETTEPEKEEEAPAPTTPTPTTPTNPGTSDISVIMYALAAVSALGGVAIFKRK